MSKLVERLGPGGKDVVVVVGSEELSVPSRVVLPPPEPAPGLIRPDGTINWACPCLGGMATGPCGNPFREAFTCFHYSDAEPKGSDCYEKFSEMQSCMSQYPELYSKDEDEELSAALDHTADQSALRDTSTDQSALGDTSADQSALGDTASAADTAVLAH